MTFLVGFSHNKRMRPETKRNLLDVFVGQQLKHIIKLDLE
jgi:hypothetical protein